MGKSIRDIQLSPEGLHIAHVYTIKHFKFRTLNEAYQCVQTIAALCPKPALASVALTEIFVNAIEHGNLGITFQEKASFANQQDWLAEVGRRLTLKENIRKYVQVRLKVTLDHIKITVKDCGWGFDWEKFRTQKVPISSFHGRGILLASELLDELHYLEPGNAVECIIYLPSHLPNIFGHQF